MKNNPECTHAPGRLTEFEVGPDEFTRTGLHRPAGVYVRCLDCGREWFDREAASPYRPAAPACTDFDVIYCEACSLPVGQEAVGRRPHPPVYCSERCRDEAEAPHVV